jgi:hypothetical protein
MNKYQNKYHQIILLLETNVPDNRLASLSDEIGLLSSAQAGFRNSHSTADILYQTLY